MNLLRITSKKLRPKRLLGSKKSRSSVSRSDSPSFGYASSASSSSTSSLHEPASGSCAEDTGTPTSVLPDVAGDWTETDFSSDTNFELVQAFKLIDRDDDGLISRSELEALLTRIGTDPPSQEEVSLMLNEVDRGNGCISLEALVGQVGSACGPACDTELRETFDFFDADHDGKITGEELFNVFTAIGDKRCTLVDCQRIIAGVDKNGGGFVCFEDFSRMMELQ